MGLDLLEFVLSVEEAFGLTIPDAPAATLTTPRRLIDHLHGRLPVAAEGCCLSQRAFYRLRQALFDHLEVDRSLIRPDADLHAAFPESLHAIVWEYIWARFGTSRWPRELSSWWHVLRLRPVYRVRDIVRFMVTWNPRCLRMPGEGWTRRQVAEVVHGLIEVELGTPRSKYTEDSRWHQDMQVD